jgi:hypothetical protein
MSAQTKKKARRSLLNNSADQDEEVAVTSRYWRLPHSAVDDTSDNQLLRLPTIFEDDYEFSMATGIDQLHSAQSTGPVAQRKVFFHLGPGQSAMLTSSVSLHPVSKSTNYCRNFGVRSGQHRRSLNIPAFKQLSSITHERNPTDSLGSIRCAVSTQRRQRPCFLGMRDQNRLRLPWMVANPMTWELAARVESSGRYRLLN